MIATFFGPICLVPHLSGSHADICQQVPVASQGHFGTLVASESFCSVQFSENELPSSVRLAHKYSTDLNSSQRGWTIWSYLYLGMLVAHKPYGTPFHKLMEEDSLKLTKTVCL